MTNTSAKGMPSSTGAAVALLFGITLCLGGMPATARAEASATVIRHVTVIDGTGMPPMENVDILIDAGKIAAIGSDLAVPAGTNDMDGDGKFVIPGLIDTHVHLQAPMVFQLTPEEKEAIVDHIPKAFLYNGVTTVLNVGSPLEWILERRQAQRDGRLVSPRIYATGESFKPEGGWGARHGGALTSAEQARKLAEEYVAAGVDGFKIIIEDGLGGHGTHTEIPEDMLRAVAGVAHAANSPIYVHAMNLGEYHRAVGIRPRAIVHGLEDPVPDGDKLFRDLIANSISVTPTLSLFEAFTRADPRAGANLDDPVLKGSVPAFLLENLRREDYRKAENQQFTTVARMDPYEWAREAVPVLRDNVTRMHRAGIELAVGTDAGGPVGYNFQGYNTPWEVKLLVECGLTPMEALVAATRNGARVIGVEDEVGTLEPGKRADLLVLSADPLDDIENIREIEWVVQDGVPHRREIFAAAQ